MDYNERGLLKASSNNLGSKNEKPLIHAEKITARTVFHSTNVLNHVQLLVHWILLIRMHQHTAPHGEIIHTFSKSQMSIFRQTSTSVIQTDQPVAPEETPDAGHSQTDQSTNKEKQALSMPWNNKGPISSHSVAALANIHMHLNMSPCKLPLPNAHHLSSVVGPLSSFGCYYYCYYSLPWYHCGSLFFIVLNPKYINNDFNQESQTFSFVPL